MSKALWLLPFLLLGAGAYLEVGPGKRPNSGWGATILGVSIAFIGFLGAFEVLHLSFLGEERGGGRIGRFLASILEPLLTSPGAFVVTTERTTSSTSACASGGMAVPSCSSTLVTISCSFPKKLSTGVMKSMIGKSEKKK